MNNLEFLQYINAPIYKKEDSFYYIFIPMINSSNEKSYKENYNNGIYIKLENSLLDNSDISDILDELTSPIEEDPTINEPSDDEPIVDDVQPTEPTTEEPTNEEPIVDDNQPTEPTTEESTNEEPIVDDDQPTEPSDDDQPTEPSDDEPIVDNDQPTEPTTDEPAEEIEEEPLYEIIESNIDIDFIRIYSFNYRYFAKINELIGQGIEEDMILDFYQSFMNVINIYVNVQNLEDIKTQIYKRVIDYYSNGQTDCTVVGLSLILQSSVYNYSDISAFTNCGCNSLISSQQNPSQTSNGISTNVDCLTTYKQSMYLYLVQMFSDIDFYNNFMFVEDEPNEELIDYLLQLIESLESMEFSLNFNVSTNHCLCSELEIKNQNNYAILDNFKKVLNWVKECKIEENTNKIKVYGKQFAELLLNLQFN